MWDAALSVTGFILGGAVGWLGGTFVGNPIRRFFDIRHSVIQARDRYSRFITGSPSLEIASLFATRNDKPAAIAAFRAIGLDLTSFAENETLARIALGIAGYDPELSGRRWLDLSEALTSADRMGPTRTDLLAPLRLKP